MSCAIKTRPVVPKYIVGGKARTKYDSPAGGRVPDADRRCALPHTRSALHIEGDIHWSHNTLSVLRKWRVVRNSWMPNTLGSTKKPSSVENLTSKV